MSVASVTLKLFTCLRIAINNQVPSLLLVGWALLKEGPLGPNQPN